MKLVSLKELSNIGKTAIALIATIAALLQVPQVSSIIFKLANAHPHVATITGAITTLAALLANPQVQKILGYTATQKTSADGTTLTTTQTAVITKETA